MSIPDIRTDEEAVALIRELKHRLKARYQFKGLTPICDVLEMALGVVIEECGLSSPIDHALVELRKEYRGPAGMCPELEARVQKILSSTKRGVA